jgi:hypothetical protein
MLTPYGGECSVTVDVYDWQGLDSIDAVYVQAPDFFDGTIELGDPVDNGNYFTFSGIFTNELGGSGEDIPVLIRVVDTAASGNPYLEAFQVGYVTVNDVVITLEEDAAYKTPGTNYNFGQKGYELSVVEPPIDYLDYDGPWDFTVIDIVSDVHRLMLSPDDPEVSEFVDDYDPTVDVFVRDPGTAGLVYRAEEHNYAEGALFFHGMHSKEDFQGSLEFGTPMVFPYPYDINTDITDSKTVTIIPTVLWITFEYHITCVGQGWVKVPLDGGTWHHCLYLRTTVELTTGGSMGEGWAGTLLYLEWIADDGTVVAQVLSGNDADEGFNFDPDTWEITGEATFMALQEITNF